MDEAMVAKVDDHEASDLPEQVKVALRFMEAWILEHARTLDEARFAELRRHFSDKQIIELTALAGIYQSAHKFNRLFEMEAPGHVFEFEEPRAPQRLQPCLEQMQARGNNTP